MAKPVQLQVNIAELENSQKKLARLSKSVANRRVKLQFTQAKGTVVDNLLLTANQLNEIGTTLAELIGKTETAVSNTKIAFLKAEKTSAQCFWSSEG